MNRNVSIGLTVITALCCGCSALMSCIFGGFIATGQPISTEVNGIASAQTYPVGVGIALLCFSVILIAIPIAVGFFTLRKKPVLVATPDMQDFGGPIPPAS